MTTKYQCSTEVPNEVIINRLKELCTAFAGVRELINREFNMRIKAELDRDADCVLFIAATRLEKLNKIEDVINRYQNLNGKYEYPGNQYWSNELSNAFMTDL